MTVVRHTWGLEWDRRFMEQALEVARWSKDPARRVGAVLKTHSRMPVSEGYNGLPRGVRDTPERLLDKELKNRMTVHAELNAILNARGNTHGTRMYCTSFPCHECAKAIIQAGVVRLTCPAPRLDSERWTSSYQLSMEMLHEAGVVLVQYLPNSKDFITHMPEWHDLMGGVR